MHAGENTHKNKVPLFRCPVVTQAARKFHSITHCCIKTQCDWTDCALALLTMSKTLIKISKFQTQNELVLR